MHDLSMEVSRLDQSRNMRHSGFPSLTPWDFPLDDFLNFYIFLKIYFRRVFYRRSVLEPFEQK